MAVQRLTREQLGCVIIDLIAELETQARRPVIVGQVFVCRDLMQDSHLSSVPSMVGLGRFA